MQHSPMNSETLQLHLDPATKRELTKICEVLGYSTSQAIDLCVKVAIASGSVSSEIKYPNETTLATLQELEERKGTKVASTAELFRDLGVEEGLVHQLDVNGAEA